MLELLTRSLDFSLEHLQFGDLGPNEFLPDLDALAVGEKLGDLVEAEAGVLPHANQPDPVAGTWGVAALSRFPRRRRHEASAFIETDRGNGCGGRLCKLTDAESRFHLT